MNIFRDSMIIAYTYKYCEVYFVIDSDEDTQATVDKLINREDVINIEIKYDKNDVSQVRTILNWR
jgi:hypothetical protein